MGDSRRESPNAGNRAGSEGRVFLWSLLYFWPPVAPALLPVRFLSPQDATHKQEAWPRKRLALPEQAHTSMKIAPTKRLAISILAMTLLLAALAPPAPAQDLPWQHIGPPGGNVISLAVSAKNTVYLGTADGHIFVSDDAGLHWSLRGRVGTRHDAVVQKLLVNTQHENELLAAVWYQDVHEGGGLFRSSDAGATWTLAGLSGEIVRAVEQASSAAEIFVAGTRSGVFRSTDAAQSWQRISPADDPELRNVDSVAIDPRDAQTIYAGTYHLPWKTSDAGKTWSAVAAGMIDDSDIMSLRVDSASPGRIFASACSGIYRSENAGAVWTKLQGIPYSSRRTQAIVQDPADPRILYAATTEGLWATRDSGESWARISPRQWVVNDVVAIPAAAGSSGNSPSQILLGTEAQGLLISGDGGITFTPVNNGFSHRITAALVADPGDPQHLLAWMPDSPNALVESRDGGDRWQALQDGSPASAPPAEIAHVFPSDAGWWLAGPKGTLSLYDSAAGKWLPLRFAAARPAAHGAPGTSRGSSRGATSSTSPGTSSGLDAMRRRATVRSTASPPLPTAGSDISGVLTVGARIFVATAQGLWSGTLGEKILRPVTVAANSQTDATEQSSLLWVMAGGEILQSADAGKTWRPVSLAFAPEVRDTDVRWMREIKLKSSGAGTTDPGASTANGSPATLFLAGTTQGLYRRSGDQRAWQLVQNGLPAGEPISYFFADGAWVLAMRSGGLYLSRDASRTWERVDAGAIAGPFTGVAVAASGKLVVASLTEGLLRD
jgi:photosystem II stability/assembly factor-like uncharacterized protein